MKKRLCPLAAPVLIALLPSAAMAAPINLPESGAITCVTVGSVHLLGQTLTPPITICVPTV